MSDVCQYPHFRFYYAGRCLSIKKQEIQKYTVYYLTILIFVLSLQVGQVTFGHDSIDHLDGAFNRVYDFGPTDGLGRVFPLPMGPNQFLFDPYNTLVYHGRHSDTGGPKWTVAIQQSRISCKIFFKKLSNVVQIVKFFPYFQFCSIFPILSIFQF